MFVSGLLNIDITNVCVWFVEKKSGTILVKMELNAFLKKGW